MDLGTAMWLVIMTPWLAVGVMKLFSLGAEAIFGTNKF